MSRRSTLLYLLLLALVLNVLVTRTVRADDDSEDKDKTKGGKDAADADDDVEQCDFATQEQELEAKLKNRGFEALMTAKSGKCGIRTDIAFGCDGQCALEGKFKSKGDPTVEKKAGLKVTLNKISEVSSLSIDYVTSQEHSFGSFSWTAMSCNCDGVETSDDDVLSACGSTISCSQQGTKDVNGEEVQLSLVYYLAAAPRDLPSGYALRANAVKFDFAVTNWQFESEEHFVAVDATVATKSKLAKKDDDNDDVESSTRRGTKKVRGLAAIDQMGLFWSPTYESGGAEYNVTVLDDPQSNDEKKVVFIFENAGGDVNWDPETSLGTGSSSAGTMHASLFLALAPIVVIASIYF